MSKLIPIFLIISVLVISGCTQENQSKTSADSAGGQTGDRSNGNVVLNDKPSDIVTYPECEKFNNEIDRDICYAQAKQDPTFCDKIPITETVAKKFCYSTVAQTAKVSTAQTDIVTYLPQCEEWKDQLDRYTCYAQAKQDPTFCEKIQNQPPKNVSDKSLMDFYEKLPKDYSKNLCYGIVAETAENSVVCEKLPVTDQSNKDVCYDSVAVKAKDPTLCDKIQEDQDTKYYCLSTTKQDPTFCEKIQDQDTKDDCYWSAAVKAKDSTLCDKIQDQGLKNNCKTFVK